MPAELMLNFPDPTQVAVHLLDEYADMTSAFAFVNPLTDKEMEEIRWYLEEYGIGYRAEPDDERADRVREQLPRWGTALFEAVFKADDKAYELFRNFRDEEEKGRLLTIAADHPSVLSLPWELLRSSGGVFLFGETPRISIRRRLPMAGQGRRPHKRNPKPALRLLFIVSRPENAGFINPRTDPQSVLDALEQQEQRRVEVEFLRPATLAALQERLRDEDLPAVDIIHFDGHGVFDFDGKLGTEAAKTHVPQYMKELLFEAESKGETAATPKHTGYLLFEDDQGKKALVEARLLGELFHRQRIGLVVLSACQSAAMDAEDAMSSVAAWLTHAGIPGVLAMTHSVLVATAGILFDRFYRSLFRGASVGKALDDARASLFYDPKRGERLRGFAGNQSVILELHDWFLPALYQTGPNRPLLNQNDGEEVPKPDIKHNLPKMQESGFFGRTRELWRIERAFTVQRTRRFSVTGFGGQGKTYLGLEAGYWLLRIGLFERVCFVSFAGFQGVDPVGVTVSTLATVLDESLPDAEAAEAALKRTSTLLILDNLESLADGAGLHELLSAATRWSEAGNTRVLLTSRQPDFNHPDYLIAGSFRHQCLPLEGLGIQDALDWFGELMRLPPEPKFGMPERSALIDLFHKVGFHPLSIGLLAQQLKERRPAELGERLEALLEEQPADREDRSLLASLELSLERLPERCREWLPRLGVFQGGCLEVMVCPITGLKEADWQELRSHLLNAGLIQEERVPNTENTFLRFHPTLAPALWQRLGKEEQDKLLEGCWQSYYQLSGQLYRMDRTYPHAACAVARCELPNLLRAVHAALQTDKAEEGVDFAKNVNCFLRAFGMLRDYKELTEMAAKIDGTIDSQAWFVARFNSGEQLFYGGQPAAAEQVFEDIFASLGEIPSYNNCLILGMLGLCCREQGQHTQAERHCQQALKEIA
ncbi:MAG: CHAT domain-containing protein, partial [Candidatus Electrothrix sp. AR5]|nr:CHAT domain-containing protein [Candidatus Electrothrix sp. AR5]